MKLKKILETSLYVKDLNEAEKFYVGILCLEIVKRSQSIPLRDLFLRCGNTMLLLFDAEQTKIDIGKVPTHGASGQGHLAFGVQDSEFPYWEKHLIENNIPIEKKANWEQI